MLLWNAHPRVFLPIEETGTALCPYCGTRYTLKGEVKAGRSPDEPAHVGALNGERGMNDDTVRCTTAFASRGPVSDSRC